MLFRSTTGELILIQRADYVTDEEYYRCIMKTIDPVATDAATSSYTATQFPSLRAIAKVVPLEEDTECHDKA
jgi:hypothetical protein